MITKTYKKFIQDRCPLLAQALTQSAVFSLFPFLFGLISISVYILGSSESFIERLLPLLKQIFPQGLDAIIKSIAAVKQASVVLAILGGVFFLWAVSGIFRTIETSLNFIWQVKNDRPFLKKSLFTMLLTLFIIILIIVSVVLTFWASASGVKIFIFSPLINLFVNINTFALIFKFMPNYTVKFPEAYIGGMFVGFFWELAKFLFSIYVTKIVDYSIIYGSLSAIIILFLWIYYSAYIFLFGAELSYIFAHRREYNSGTWQK